MCVIFTLLPNQMIPESKLENAVGNNLHGYGILMHLPGERKKLDLIKGFEKDGIDHNKVFEILDHNRDLVRHVHLRNMTHGVIGEENVHPFKVFESEERTVYLMHNGSFPDFKPDHNDTRNDTRIFCERFLSPLLDKFEGGWGKGDYNDPLFRQIVSKFVGYNRVLLVSNDLLPGYFGDWKDVDGLDGQKFKASNNDYFNYISRGPRRSDHPFRTGQGNTTETSGTTMTPNTGIKQVSPSPATQQEGFKKTEEKITTTSAEVVNLSTVNFERPKFEPSLALLKTLGASTGEMWDDHHFSMLGWAKDAEILTFIKELSDKDKVWMIRDMVTAIEELDMELATAEDAISKTEDEVKDLIHTNSLYVAEIERLKRKIANLEGLPWDEAILEEHEIRQQEAA